VTGELLWVVMPVYNEEASVARVLDEWLPALRAVSSRFRVLAIDDGSRDGTLRILKEQARANPEVLVLDQANRGHGQACAIGYRQAAEAGADWVLQIDSDGQCDPAFLPALWARRSSADVIMGFRASRDDGVVRWLISRVVSLVVLLSLRVWVSDPNVPYRLMRVSALRPVVDRIPSDFHLVNVLVAAELQRHVGITWVRIHFRDRHGGSPAVQAAGFMRRGLQLYHQLRAVRARARPCCDG